ncbi:ABC transporter permease [Eggerthella sinensis]|uniref:ABC transporter permease n=1 Tax=Eggerthella sinensis TaxID=242230 RepID=UPI00266CBC5A|nr:ABC transporter permease [Eggerthella sinensis]
MRNALAIARRVLSQFAHDKRTLALLFVAPVVVLWLLSVLLGADAYEPRLATVDLPASFQTALNEQDARITDTSQAEAERLLRANEADAVLRMRDDTTLEIWAEGSDSTKTAAAANVVAKALSEAQKDAADEMKADVEERKTAIEDVLVAQGVKGGPLADELDSFDFDMADYLPVQDMETTYLHGTEDWKMFDFYGPVFIGIFVFVFVFLTSGMSLVNERGAGTMTRFLATPVKPVQILGGYTLGFGLLALVQAAVILFIALTFIGFPNEGAVWLVTLLVVSMALASVTLGLLVSGLAKSGFQVIQLMLLFVVPQILLSGLFDLSSAPEWMQVLGQCFPITYGVDALRAVMLRGADFASVGIDLAVIWGFIALFFALAALKFRKKRVRG